MSILCIFSWILSPYLVHCYGHHLCHFCPWCAVFVPACYKPRLCPHLVPQSCRVSSLGTGNDQLPPRHHREAQPVTSPAIMTAKNTTAQSKVTEYETDETQKCITALQMFLKRGCFLNNSCLSGGNSSQKYL